MTKNQHIALGSSFIGVMDSGVGGLSVLAHCQSLLSKEAFLYVADSRYAPYGPKSDALIISRCVQIADYLIEQGARAIVVACNTATAAAIQTMRKKYAVPVIGMEPALKPAVSATRNQKIGVLATTGTLQSAKFAALLDNFAQGVTVTTQACEGLVECVEQGELDSPATLALLQRYCEPLMAEGVDTIVLGCTHYPFLKKAIQSIVGESVALIETGAAVANQLQRQLEKQSAPSAPDLSANLTVMTNSDADAAFSVIEKLIGATALDIKHFDW